MSIKSLAKIRMAKRIRLTNTVKETIDRMAEFRFYKNPAIGRAVMRWAYCLSSDLDSFEIVRLTMKRMQYEADKRSIYNP